MNNHRNQKIDKINTNLDPTQSHVHFVYSNVFHSNDLVTLCPGVHLNIGTANRTDR